jgi:PAS domain S-box-containing protein
MARRAAQIIENAKLHQQLQRSDARFRAALDHANIAVVETDLDRRIRWIHNTRLEVPYSAILGKTASEFFGAGTGMGASLDDLQRRVLETGEGARSTLSTDVSGALQHILVVCEPLRGADGIVGLTGATIDVTELKEAEERLARELGFRERMMGVLGHDLRNPVGAIISLAGLMRQQATVSDKACEQLAHIEQAARRMNEMIGTLLDFTRLRFLGSLPVSLEDVDLGEVAGKVVAELRAAHRRGQIELLTSGNLHGRWDPGRIAQLLSNLAANALSYGADGSPVTVTLTEAGDAVHLSVSNLGSAIAPEHVERLFEPFQQGGDADESTRKGLGLGLFIVREIVRAHGGTIDVRSSDAQTTFEVSLPRVALPS